MIWLAMLELTSTCEIRLPDPGACPEIEAGPVTVQVKVAPGTLDDKWIIAVSPEHIIWYAGTDTPAGPTVMVISAGAESVETTSVIV